MQHQKNRQVALPSFLSGWGFASCVVVDVLLHLVCIHQVVIVVPSACDPLGGNAAIKKKGGITGTDGMTDRLHLQTRPARIKLERKESVGDTSVLLFFSRLHPSVRPGCYCCHPCLVPLSTPSYLT